METLNNLLALNHLVAVVRDGSNIALESDKVHSVLLSPREFSAIGPNCANANLALVSPSGKIIFSCQEKAFFLTELSKFNVCLQVAHNNNNHRVSSAPVKKSADEWVMAKPNSDVKQSDGVSPCEVDEPLPSSPPRDEIEPSSSRTAVTSLVTPVTKCKFSVTIPDVTSNIVLEEDHFMLLRDVLDKLNCISLTLKFPPRKEFSLEEFGDKSVGELNFNGVALMGKKLHRSNATAAIETTHPFITWLFQLWAWIVALFLSFTQSTPPPSSQVKRLRQSEPKKNEYWNGDSTVFQSPNSDGEEEESLKME